MADNDESVKKPKRRLRQAQTVREQTQQAQTRAGKPRRGRGFFRMLGAPFRLIGRGFRWLGRFKPLRLIGLVLYPRYFRNSFHELRQVTWPNWKQSRQLTGAVIIFSVIFGILIAVVDYGLDKVFKKVILKQ